MPFNDEQHNGVLSLTAGGGKTGQGEMGGGASRATAQGARAAEGSGAITEAKGTRRTTS